MATLRDAPDVRVCTPPRHFKLFGASGVPFLVLSHESLLMLWPLSSAMSSQHQSTDFGVLELAYPHHRPTSPICGLPDVMLHDIQLSLSPPNASASHAIVERVSIA
ncbi:hypothetical protein K438DRAFT_1772631 [Mycena galopus ATCC 62051]|nr:hypothetical protein K438DRAFT_1772631 [Mycena galopus ATCC 62051]